eukprot:3425589-Alexandrium_andersonii.AAC.1
MPSRGTAGKEFRAAAMLEFGSPRSSGSIRNHPAGGVRAAAEERRVGLHVEHGAPGEEVDGEVYRVPGPG